MAFASVNLERLFLTVENSLQNEFETLGWQKVNRLQPGNAHQENWAESPAEREIGGPNPPPSSSFKAAK